MAYGRQRREHGDALRQLLLDRVTAAPRPNCEGACRIAFVDADLDVAAGTNICEGFAGRSRSERVNEPRNRMRSHLKVDLAGLPAPPPKDLPREN